MTYTITIPCYRSEKFLETTVHEVVKEMDKIAPYDYEIILINDNSPDQTLDVIRKLTKKHSFIKGINLAKNVGQHNAILAALKEGTGEIFINLDDDLQTHPNQIIKLLKKLDEGYDVVYARFESSTYGKRKQFTSWLHHWVIGWFLDKEEKWVATSFWVAKQFIIQEIIKYSSEYTDMQSNFIRATNSIANQEVEHHERKNGESGYTFKKSLKLWSSTLNYTEKPAILMLSVGAILAITATILYLIFSISYLMGHNSSAGTTNYLISLVLSTLLIIGGFLGIYLSRILKIVEDIPSVVVKEKINFAPKENKTQEKTEAIFNFLNKKEDKNEYNENKKILILGAGNFQYDAIRYLKDAGHKVYSCSYTDTDKAIPYVDEFRLINILDVEKVMEYAKEINADIIYSIGSDIAMPPAMKVSQLLDKPHFIHPDTAVACNTKYIFRNILGPDFQGNVKYKIVTEKEDLKEITFFPAMMKPADSQGQRGVKRCDNLADLEKQFDNSMEHSRNKTLIVEQFIEGNEISLNAYMVDGKMRYARISDRISFEDLPGGIIKKHLVPSRYQDTIVEKQVLSMAENALKTLNINNGPAYFQIMVDHSGSPYVIEVTPRLDGCHMWNLLKHYDGVNLLDSTFKHLLGEQITLDKKTQDKKMSLEFMCQPPNTAFDSSKHTVPKQAKYVRWYYEDGDNVRPLNGIMEKCAYAIKMEE